MPSAAEHQAKATHNKSFLQTITDPKFCDWMAVISFYVAVHLVEQLFALKGQHSKDHRGRNKAVRLQFRPIHKHFRALYNLSMVARYQQASTFKLDAYSVKSYLIDYRLAEIEKFVTSQTAPQSLPPPSSSPPITGS